VSRKIFGSYWHAFYFKVAELELLSALLEHERVFVELITTTGYLNGRLYCERPGTEQQTESRLFEIYKLC
jgi:hypothetical protein